MSFATLVDTIDGIGVLVVIYEAGRSILAGAMTVAEGMSLVTYVLRLVNPIISIIDYINDYSSFMSLKDDYQEIINYENWMMDGDLVLDSFENEIKLDDVSFSYNSSSTVLNHLNMEIHKGERIGICGISGNGKSTIFKLINRFYEQQSGTITIDGVDIRDITEDSYRSKIGSVHQENNIFPGSIMENVRYGSPNATDAEVIEACKMAHIYDFINSLPDRFNTEVGPRGLKLSGGQKQRIALARLFLRDPEIILLDEATSALDNESETFIQEAIDALQGKTIITIAHRLSTIQNSDRIYVIGNGTVVEQGTHQELIDRKGVYFSMIK
jgi:ABC-type multidrug transport system fused ATPase/permease subunit